MDADLLAAWVTGVIATLVAIGGLYLVPRLRATTAIAVVAAGVVSIWLARTGSRLASLHADHGARSCVPEGFSELARSWPIVAAAIPPIGALAVAALGFWSTLIGLHAAQALDMVALIAIGLVTGRRLRASPTAQLSFVLWLAVSGLLVVGLEALSRAI